MPAETVTKVAVIDLGGQYAHLIARRIREQGVYAELYYPWEADEAISESKAIVLSGGPSSVWESHHDTLVEKALGQGKPVLGICYGHQLLAKVLGGTVGPSPNPEFGPTLVEVLRAEGILQGYPSQIRVWMSHNDAVLEPPKGSKILARSNGSPVAAFSINDQVFGVQWHPEVRHSELGAELIGNWLRIARVPREWRPGDLIQDLVDYVRRTVGDSIALSAVSGGVDSTVATVIAHRALGDRLHAVLIDHGFHPAGEIERAVRFFRKLGIDLEVIDASEEFYTALEGVEDPEEKRRVFGAVYARILEREARLIGAEYLVQGTIYPDVIESGGRRGADRIKSHHNVAGLPRRFGLKLVEPLKLFYKDEVRVIGKKLGIPEEVLYKQPVPGPALVIRVEGRITPKLVEIARKANRIVAEEVEKRGLGRKLWQYFAVVTRSRATGVKGDKRAYGVVIAVRIVESTDAMTANPYRAEWGLLESIASRITSEIPEATRVVYDITSKPPGTIEWE
ncbi:MAG: glutamine-hydrolyzing GMP synthase [Desulfurococcales archaeon]|nr:glutamine-hydrolyzing GMP synthase [Desulfurococcales archaeon]